MRNPHIRYECSPRSSFDSDSTLDAVWKILMRWGLLPAPVPVPVKRRRSDTRLARSYERD